MPDLHDASLGCTKAHCFIVRAVRDAVGAGQHRFKRLCCVCVCRGLQAIGSHLNGRVKGNRLNGRVYRERYLVVI